MSAPELLGALPWLARAGWFALGAAVATGATLFVLRGPLAQRRAPDAGLPYEGLPLADNSGVCQEFVALASVRTSRAGAQRLAQRLAAALPSGFRADNLRVVRQFAPGEAWTLAVDTQPGTGDAAHAAQVAAAMNAATSLARFEPVFYSSHQLYDAARVLCMPRQGVATR